jgi:thiamine-monophosphate kinase
VEQSFLAWLKGRIRHLPQVATGIGDDAAVLDIPPGVQLVATTDAIIDQVDFLWETHSPRDIGYKAMAINLSDVAAMGGTPTAALVTISLPSTRPTEVAAAVYEGIIEAAQQYHVSIAGGDISVYDGPLSIAITMLGHVPTGKAWLRSGAREGDCLILSGPIGGSLLGRHLRPTPRLDLVEALRGRVEVHAAIDISDGFSLDLDRLCAASGVGAQVDTAAIPIHGDAAIRAETSGRKGLDHALGDGEDFELILALAPDDWERVREECRHLGLVCVGRFIGRTGLWSLGPRGLQRMLASGYIHGRKRDAGV